MAELKEKKKLSPYFYLVIIILAFMVSGFCQYKLQTILTYIYELQGIDSAKGGLLLSQTSVLAIFITIPLGVLMNKIGARRMGLLGIAVVTLGSLLGTFFTKNYTMLMISQLIVGAGSAAISIVGPYIISVMFIPAMRGRANGWYITAGTIAQLLMYNIIPRIVTPTDITPAWWLTNIYGAVMFVIWFIFITDEVAPKPAPHEPAAGEKKIGMLDALKDPKVLQIFVGMIFFMLSAVAVLSFTPSYLVQARGYDVKTAGSLVSVCAIVGAVSTAVGGTLSDLLKTRKWIYFGAIMWMCVSRVLIAFLPNGFLLNLTIWLQGLPSVAMGLAYTVAGEAIDKEKTAVAMSVLSTGTKIGAYFAATIFGFLAASIGFQWSYVVYAVLTLGGLIGVCTIKGVK